jgi:hypothetical protein
MYGIPASKPAKGLLAQVQRSARGREVGLRDAGL